ncbi:MAG: flagellar hook-length control protein FliK [Candidatus Hydrogenedentes bacterium]|nr:flagellar hook-length control protein FliK [Candidatus Hydrogenedentota bacterium]
MIAISQLLQVVQASEAAAPQATGPAENSAPGGLAQLFGAILERARATLGEKIAPPDSGAVTQTETGPDVQGSGEVEGGEGLAPNYEELPIEHAASVLEALDKFEALPIEHAASVLEALEKFETLPFEHAASVLEALREGAQAALVEDSQETGPVELETEPDTEEGVNIDTLSTVDEVVGELLAAMSAVPVQPVPIGEDGMTEQRPVAAPQPQRVAAQASLGPPHAASAPIRLDSGLLAAASKATAPPMEFGPPGLPPGSARLRAAAKAASEGKPAADLRGSAVPAALAADARGPAVPVASALEVETVYRPTLGEVFARALTRQQPQASPTPGGPEMTPVETAVLEPLEALTPAVKPQGAPALAQTLVPPGAAEVVQGAAAPKGDGAIAQSIPERPPPEVVHVRDVGDFTVKTVRYLAGRHEDVVTVRLVPRSLGELHIAVRSTGESIDVVITAATHAAREAIEALLPGLREALVRDGGEVKNVTIQTSTAGDTAPGHFGPGHSATSGHAARTALKFTGDQADPQADPRASPRGSAGHEGSLNMFV